MDMMPNNPPMGDAPAKPVKQPIKIAMGSLPPGTKEGDTLELTVKTVDPVSNMVELTHEGDAEELTDSVTEESDGEESSAPSMDTKTLLGPMSGLKNYLVQKSQDVPKNQGH